MMRFRKVSILLGLFVAIFSAWFYFRAPWLTDAQRELIALNAEMEEAYKRYWEKYEKATPEQRLSLAMHEDPIRTSAEELLQYEASHRGSLDGLMALRSVISNAARGGPIDGPRDIARRKAVNLMHHYATLPEIVECISYLNFGNPDSGHQHITRQLIAAVGSDTEIGANLRIELCYQLLTNRRQFSSTSDRCREIENGSPEKFTNELQGLKAVLALLPNAEEIQADSSHALQDLKAISESGPSHRAVQCKPLGRFRCIVNWEESDRGTAPALSEVAEGLLVRESIANGGSTRIMNVSLLDGSQWSSTEHGDKHVVVQFSTIPCAPCEKMYLEMQKLFQSHKVECLTLFRSTEAEARNKQRSAKIHWSVACIAEHDPILTQFAVTSFPTVFLVSPDGKFHELGSSLKASVLAESLNLQSH
jgi:thiol-disulfide isomerase/thioredoxin